MKNDLVVGKRCTHRFDYPVAYKDGKWISETEDRDVILMAIVNTWAMVRRPRCVPYVCHIKELIP
jgi:hypothetical protein